MNFYKNKNFKEFPEHRVCVIDSTPVIEDSIKDTYKFCIDVGLPVHQWKKSKRDILNIFYHYSLENLCKNYKNCPSTLRKVFATYSITNSNLPVAFRDAVPQIFKVCPVAWCRVLSFTSPEIGLAAVTAVERSNCTHSKLLKFTKVNYLHAIEKKIKKNRIYSNISVDYSGVEE
jgi:hypothetical protein